MKCLVTGGSGFIGSHIVDRLCENPNNEVVVIDNESAVSNEKFYNNPLAEYHSFDIRDMDACYPLFEGVDTVFHLAAFSRIQVAMQNPQACIETNIQGTINMLECARKWGVRRFYKVPQMLRGWYETVLRDHIWCFWKPLNGKFPSCPTS